jgi:hypothetical protein
MADDAFTSSARSASTRSTSSPSPSAAWSPRLSWPNRPDLVRKLILTGTGPAGGKGIDKVAGITYWDLRRATLTRFGPKEFLFFNRYARGKPAAWAFVNRLKERTVDRDAKIAVEAFRTQKTATYSPASVATKKRRRSSSVERKTDVTMQASVGSLMAPTPWPGRDASDHPLGPSPGYVVPPMTETQRPTSPPSRA